MRAIRLAARLPLVVLAAAAGVLFLPPAAPAEPARPAIQILAPANGAALAPGKGWVIGKVADPAVGQVEVDVNAKVRQTAPVQRGAFHLQVYFSQGKNVLRVSAGNATAATAVFGTDKHTYRYHADVDQCAGCHGESPAGYALPGHKDALCYKCHDRQDKGKLLHGPMGSGDCTACHDPHGSGHKALTVAQTETLCVTCHNQKSSEAHVRRAKGKACTACHDPHSSDKKYLQK